MNSSEWSDYIQNPNFLEGSRIMLFNHDLAEFTVKKLNLKSGMKVLDVGCGTGAFTYHLAGATENVSYIGLDRDSRLICAAQLKVPKDAAGNTFEFIEANASNLPFEDNSFDVVVSHTFLTAAWEYKEAFREMIRVCRADGLVAAINISDFSKTIHRELVHMEKKDFSYERYMILRERFEKATERFVSLADKNAGINPENIPEFFEKSGLSKISVYPIGTFFSLRNDDDVLAAKQKERYIEYMKASSLERIDNFMKLRGFERYFSNDECKELEILVEEYYRNVVNSGWEYDSYLYHLVVGTKISATIAEENDRNTNLDVYGNNKYKDVKPSETLTRLKKLWEDLDIELTESFTQGGVSNLYSCRIGITGTDLGQNGKGSSPEYALASGYAELTERLSTGFLFPHILNNRVILKLSDVESQGGALYAKSIAYVYSIPMFLAKGEKLISDWAESDGTISGYYYMDISDNREYFLPEFICRDFAYTNGSCAGNTREEALVQGLCEIMERYASIRIIEKKLAPPLIRDELLMKFPEIWSTINEIRQNSNFSLYMFDASLGKRLPVVMALLVDIQNKKACVRFGSHPRMEIAVERTLTELFQGRNIKNVFGMSHFGAEYEEDVDKPQNIFNIIKMGIGTVSMNLLNGIEGMSSWSFEPWASTATDNVGFLDALLDLCKQMQWDIYVRDCSYFGFPVYHVFCPQSSMVMNFGKVSIAQSKMKHKTLLTLRNFEKASEAEQKNAIRTVELFSGWMIHDHLDKLCGINFHAELFGFPIDCNLLKVLYDIKMGNYKSAAEMLRPYISCGEEFWCLYQMLLRKSKGLDGDSNLQYVLRDSGAYERAKHVLLEPYGVLPQCSYPDCIKCKNKFLCDTFYINEKINRYRSLNSEVEGV